MAHISVVVDGVGAHVQHGLPKRHQGGGEDGQPRTSAIQIAENECIQCHRNFHSIHERLAFPNSILYVIVSVVDGNVVMVARKEMVVFASRKAMRTECDEHGVP